ncbi:MAG: hypothetical protein O3B13_21050, partial [Planctomycetota bacterium]|nr:hypothetical protein [Planctomycetota bacterium]
SWDHTVRLWDPATGLVETIMPHDGLVECLSALPDGRIVSGGDDKAIRVWGQATGRVNDIYFTQSRVVGLATSHDSSQVYAGLENGEVLFLQFERGATN